MKIQLKKPLVNFFTGLFIITFFAVSIPTHQAKAFCLFGGCINQATETTQLLNNAELAASTIQNTLTAGATAGLLSKETLDGIAWQVAKQMVSSMTRSLVNWINSGFQGSPAFITDLNGFLLDALDTTAGEYIKGLGGIGEFICSPFRLDIQAALAINYNQARSGLPSGGDACKLSGIGDNIKNFFSGVSDGGWREMLSITSNPQNLPYGAYLEAEAKLNIRLKNEAGQEIKVADWGKGFLSKKICEDVEGGGVKCSISTPGNVIGEAFNFQLSTGQRSLIQADEINEIIGALLSQLTLQAVQGINGLLGLGGNSAYTDYNYKGGLQSQSYIDAANQEQTNTYINTSGIKKQIDQSLITESAYLTLINQTITNANLKLASTSSSSLVTTLGTTSPIFLNTVLNEATTAKYQVLTNISKLSNLILAYDNASSSASSTSSAVGAIRQNIIIEYIKLVDTGTLTSTATLSSNRNRWGLILQ